MGSILDKNIANRYRLHNCLLELPVQALLVGADRLGNIPDVLTQSGISIQRHISGREKSHQRRNPNLPRDTQLVILFTDFLGHNVMQSFRAAAQEQGVPLLCCRRSTCSVKTALQAFFVVAKGEVCADCPQASQRKR